MSFPEEFRLLDDGETLRAGRLEITAIATTGHTDHHLSYLVSLVGQREPARRPSDVVCTGGSLLVDATGRTDLLGPELAEPLARSQWRSVRRLLTTLPERHADLPDSRIRKLLLGDAHLW